MKTFLQEIYQQPEVLKNLIAYYQEEGKEKLVSWSKIVNSSRQIIFSGMGSSLLVTDAVRLLLLQRGIFTMAEEAGEFLHYAGNVFSNSCFVFISQSGESIEICRLAQNVSSQFQTVAIVNDENSTLVQSSSLVLPLLAGKEMSISTKTYSNTLGLLYILSQVLSGENNPGKSYEELQNVAEHMLSIDVKEIENAAGFFLPADAVHFIARGFASSAAKQAALTFMEGARSVTCAFTGGSFRHGPYEVVERGYRAVLFIPEGKTCELMTSLATDLAGLGSTVIVITNAEKRNWQGNVREIRIPPCREELFPLMVSAAHAFLLYYVAVGRGIEPGKFRYISKVTRKE